MRLAPLLVSLVARLGLPDASEPGASEPDASEPDAREPDAREPAPAPNLPRSPLGRVPGWFGPSLASNLAARRHGEPGELPEGQIAGATIVGGLAGRLAGYTQRSTRSGAIAMLTPELMLALELGGTIGWRDSIAAQRGLAADVGPAFGTAGIASIGMAWASPGRVGAYAKIGVAQRFVARTHATLEGPYLIAGVGPSAGLRIDVPHELTVLIGGGVEGSAGVQRFDERGALIAQLAPIVEFGLYSQPRDDLYFGLVGRGDLTVLGRRYGGERLHGRATTELAWRIASPRASMAALLLTYEGTRIDAAPNHPQFAEEGERRISHQLVLAGGVAF